MFLGGYNARVPEEEIWRTAYSHLSLCAVTLPVCFHQDLSKSLWHHILTLSDQHCTSIVHYWLKLWVFSSPLHSGRHVLWGHFYQPGSRAEYLPCCCHATIDYCTVHCHRSVPSRYIHLRLHWTHRSIIKVLSIFEWHNDRGVEVFSRKHVDM